MTAAAPRSGARPRAVFFGSPAFAVPFLRAVAAETELCAVVSQPDRPAGRGQAPAAPAVKREAEALGVPGLLILQPEKIRTPETHATLAALGADLFVVVAYGRILPQTLLDLPRLGPFNVHASLLPRLRGAAPIQWAIIRGERQTGVSIMRMEAGLDTGPMLRVARVPVGEDEDAGSLVGRLAEAAGPLLVDVLHDLAAGTLQETPQPEEGVTYASKITADDRPLDLGLPAVALARRVRALSPHVGATCAIDGEPFKVWRAVASDEEAQAGLSARDGRLLAGTAEGSLEILELQPPGRGRMEAGAFLRGWRGPLRWGAGG
jgi:methionyl-tRNA formyltransferase